MVVDCLCICVLRYAVSFATGVNSNVYIHVRCAKFPDEPTLQEYVAEVIDAFIAGKERFESLSKEDQMLAQKKKDLFALLPPQTKKNLLLHASGND